MVDLTDYSSYPKEFMEIWTVKREEYVCAGHNNLAQLMEATYFGWIQGQAFFKSQSIDFTQHYDEMKKQSFHHAGLAGYRLGLTDAQSIMYNCGMHNIKGPIANKPEGFKE